MSCNDKFRYHLIGKILCIATYCIKFAPTSQPEFSCDEIQNQITVQEIIPPVEFGAYFIYK